MAELVERYATALYDAASESKSLNEFREQAAFLRSSLEENPDLKALLAHPAVAPEEKYRLVEIIYSTTVCPELINIMELLIKKNHGSLITDVLDAFLAQIAAHNNEVSAKIFTAAVMDKVQLDKVVRILEAKLSKRVTPVCIVDPTLLAGIKVEVMGRVLDLSMRNSLRSMKTALIDSAGNE